MPSFKSVRPASVWQRAQCKSAKRSRPSRARSPAAIGLAEVLCNPKPYQPTREGIRTVFNTERTVDTYESLMERLVYRRKADQPTRQPVNQTVDKPVADAERQGR